MTVTLCLSCSPDVGVNSIGAFRGPPRSGVAFPTTSGLYCLEVYWQLLRGFPRSFSVGCGLPYHISSLTLWESAGNCIGGFPSAPSVGCGLPYHIWSLLSGSLLATASGVSECHIGWVWPSPTTSGLYCLEFDWQLHRGFPSAPSVGCGLPYHIWYLLSGIRLATAWDPNSTELNNNSTPTRSPTGSLKSNV